MTLKSQNEQANAIEAAPAVLRMTIGITRKATGITETYELVSDPMPLEQAKQIVESQSKEQS
jgi:hypothetical protein